MRELPIGAGVGFKPEHFVEILQGAEDIAFFEVHAENYMGAGGMMHAQLTRLRADFPLSLHGVGLSIGGPDPLDRDHLARLKSLIDRYEPARFSEHLAWSSHGETFLNDLLPLPYTQASLARIAEHIDCAQEALGRQILLENPATYLTFAQSEIEETAFLAELARRTGCGLLLDVTNVFVSCANHGADPRAYLAAFDLASVGEIHLGGHEAEALPSGPVLIDSHGAAVAEPVWTLFAELIGQIGARPTLVEWDNNLPDWPVLAREAALAARILEGRDAG